MRSPFKGEFRVTSPRGWRWLNGKLEYHKGIDMVAADSHIYAVADGTIEILYEENGFGNYVRQTLMNGERIYYAHMDSISAKSGQHIQRGDLLGIMGATGKVTGAHLHLEIRPKGTGKSSLDISEYTGIPNAVGTYKATNRYSYDDTVDALIRCGITGVENMVNWELMLSGQVPLKREYVRVLLNRCCERIEELQK